VVMKLWAGYLLVSFLVGLWSAVNADATDYEDCRYTGTDFAGPNLAMNSPDAEEECVQSCLENPSCYGITHVSPNPSKYGADIHGCWRKVGGWTVNTGDRQANMVSVDVACIRAKTVDGEWSDYGEWGDCDADCDGGTQTRTKTCSNPAPAYFGNDCVGDASDSQPCNQNPCPVDGGWTDYGEWGACSAACGEGTQTRSRTCTKPAAAHGGAECEGEEDENKPCDSRVPCPEDNTSDEDCEKTFTCEYSCSFHTASVTLFTGAWLIFILFV